MADEIRTEEKNKQIKKWEEWASRQDDNVFALNPDHEVVERLAEGVLKNEKNHGLKYCPCRLTTGEREADKKLVCPCNFRSQKAWQEKGECWCSLFVKPR